jgi:murein DD-endopeptidase MepM/ murein hydrolase activator NlpD
VSGWRPPLYPIPWEPTPQDHFYFTRPIGANEVNWPLARYRYGGVFFQDTVHTGVDIPAPKGTPVLAAGDGEVIWAGYGLFFLREELGDPYGLAIAIKHDFGYEGEPIYTVYGHMDEIYSYRGQRVKANQVIGLVGETGHATGPHLHFEVRLEENKAYGSRNPELWMAPPQGWGVLAGRIMGSDGDLIAKRTVNLRNTETNQRWYVITYGKGGVNSDDYYQENMVIGDLPAGLYRVSVNYSDVIYATDIEILPGRVSYFQFWGKFGFNITPPPTPPPDFENPNATATLVEDGDG